MIETLNGNNSTAIEFHNHETGHCYVDYIKRTDYEDADDYIEYPLYKLSDINLLWALYDKDEHILSIHQTFEGANKNRLLMERRGLVNLTVDHCIVHH